MIYLSSTTGIPDEYKWNEFGVMFSAKYTIGGLDDAMKSGAKWMMDNNEFSGDFDPRQWVSSMIKYAPYSKNCIGIPVRDKVGDALETLRRFSKYHQIVRDLGYPVAFVTQDGITPEMIPWEFFDVLFVGGGDDHKLGQEASVAIAEAKERGKWVHIGRVNSPSRIKQFWMADSADGTNLNREAGDDRSERVSMFADAIRYCRSRKSGNLGINGQYRMELVA